MYIRKNIAETKRGGECHSLGPTGAALNNIKKKTKKKTRIKHICINAEAQGLHTI